MGAGTKKKVISPVVDQLLYVLGNHEITNKEFDETIQIMADALEEEGAKELAICFRSHSHWTNCSRCHSVDLIATEYDIHTWDYIDRFWMEELKRRKGNLSH